MLHFEKLTEETLYIASEMINSNKEYNILENGREERTEEEIREEFSPGMGEHYFIKADDTYIGMFSYLDYHEKDGYPWIGLFMIHGDYQGYGYGTMAYVELMNWLEQKGKIALRLAVLKKNEKGRRFWEGFGFTFVEEKTTPQGHVVDVYEKTL
jgi:RimJ/RimL family protein N-acetyltransferase